MNGCVTDVKVYNNTFYYNIADKSTHPVEANNWGGTFPNGVELKNNIWHMPSGSVSWVNVGMITNLTMTVMFTLVMYRLGQKMLTRSPMHQFLLTKVVHPHKIIS